MTIDPRFERSVRRWLWGYPPRWRWARADEVVGTLADLAAPGATRLDLRSGLGLVVHGLATRRRMRPPLRYRMGYALLSLVPPWQYRGWVADKIAGPLFSGGVVVGESIIWATLFFFWHGMGSRLGYFAWLALLFAAVVVTPRTGARRQAAARFLVPGPGDLPTPWDQRPAWVFRDRVAASSLLPALAGACAGVAVVGAALTVATGSGRGPVLAASLATGGALAVRLILRWRRHVPTRPAQPARRLLVAGRQTRAAVWCWGAVALGAFSWPVAGFGSQPTLAPILLGGTLVVLPPLAVGAVLARRGPADLALVDVWRLAAGLGALRADALQRGVVPAWQPPPAPSVVPLPGEPPLLPPTPGRA